MRTNTSSRDARICANEFANCGSTSPAASVPDTTTVCPSKAVKIAAAHRFHALGACLRSRVSTRCLPACRSAFGVGYFANTASMAG